MQAYVLYEIQTFNLVFLKETFHILAQISALSTSYFFICSNLYLGLCLSTYIVILHL